jgi:hypothetical protein
VRFRSEQQIPLPLVFFFCVKQDMIVIGGDKLSGAFRGEYFLPYYIFDEVSSAENFITQYLQIVGLVVVDTYPDRAVVP